MTDRDAVLASFANIEWDSLARAGFAERAEVELLRRTEELGLEYILANADESAQLAALLLKLLAGCTDSSVTAYVLTRIEDILAEGLQQKVALFQSPGGASPEIDCAPFMRAMENGDAYSQKAASTSLALMLTVSGGEVESLVGWLCRQLANSHDEDTNLRAAVPALAILLRCDRARLTFWRNGGLSYLTKLLKSAGTGTENAQMLYELCFCLWTMSFMDDIRPDFLPCGVIASLVDQVAAAPREKVVRVALAALRNLTNCDNSAFNAEMIACELPKTLKNMTGRQWADPDIADDVDAIHAALQNDFRELSTFERYEAELRGGQLKWGLVHTEKFWRENCRAFETDDFRMLKTLIALLESDDDEVVSIACYDIGEWVRFYPNGKSIAKHLGAKDMAMGLIEHASPEIQRHALQCVSKIMVQQWDFIRT